MPEQENQVPEPVNPVPWFGGEADPMTQKAFNSELLRLLRNIPKILTLVTAEEPRV